MTTKLSEQPPKILTGMWYYRDGAGSLDDRRMPIEERPVEGTDRIEVVAVKTRKVKGNVNPVETVVVLSPGVSP